MATPLFFPGTTVQTLHKCIFLWVSVCVLLCRTTTTSLQLYYFYNFFSLLTSVHNLALVPSSLCVCTLHTQSKKKETRPTSFAFIIIILSFRSIHKKNFWLAPLYYFFLLWQISSCREVYSSNHTWHINSSLTRRSGISPGKNILVLLTLTKQTTEWASSSPLSLTLGPSQTFAEVKKRNAEMPDKNY